MKSEEFLLKKQWEQIDEVQKGLKQPQNFKSVIPDRPLKRTSIFKDEDDKKEDVKKN